MDAEGNEYKYAECEYFNNETYGKFTVEKTGLSLAGFEEIKTTMCWITALKKIS